MPSGKRIRLSTIRQYEITGKLIEEFEKTTGEILEIRLMHRTSLRQAERNRNYWQKFYRKLQAFLYHQKNSYDNYSGFVLKNIKVFLRYLEVERNLPVGDFYKAFHVPKEMFTPVIISPEQLRFLIINKEFENTLTPLLRKIKDIFVFGCTVGLRFQDLMLLKYSNLQLNGNEKSLVLQTRKTGTEVFIPLPDYAIVILNRLKRGRKSTLIPGISGSHFNSQLKKLIKLAGWDYFQPKYRHRQGEKEEIKTKEGETFRFYQHITAHTMRRTAITTLLLLGVDENAVRRISGHAPGSKEFYRYVVLSRDFLNKKVRAAQARLISGEFNNFTT